MISYNLASRIPEIIAHGLPDGLDEALEQGAEAIAEDAKGRVPVETGALQNAIHVEEGREELTFIVVAGDDEAFYGHIIEHGGVNVPARPFLIPAAEAQGASIDALAIEAMEDV